MQRLVGFARAREVLLVHDFAYADIAFDGYEPPSILRAEGAAEVAVELYSLTEVVIRLRLTTPAQAILGGGAEEEPYYEQGERFSGAAGSCQSVRRPTVLILALRRRSIPARMVVGRCGCRCSAATRFALPGRRPSLSPAPGGVMADRCARSSFGRSGSRRRCGRRTRLPPTVGVPRP